MGFVIMTEVESSSDERVANNAVRHKYRILSDEEKSAMLWFKDAGASFITYVGLCGKSHGSREMDIAIMKMEEAVMWAVKGITG